MSAMRLVGPSGAELESDFPSVESAIERAVGEFDLPTRAMDNRVLSWALQQDGTVLRSGPITEGTWVLVADGGEAAIEEIEEAIGELRTVVAGGEAATTPHLMTKLTLIRRTGAREPDVDELDAAIRGARRDDTRGQKSRRRSAFALPIVAGVAVLAVGVLVAISMSGRVDRPDPVFEPSTIESVPAVIDGEISVRGEIDRFEIELEQDQAIEIRLNGQAAFQEMDTDLRLIGPGGNELAYNDDFQGLNSRLVHVAAEPGTYVIEAGGLGGCCVGAYQLTVDAIDADGLEAVDVMAGDLPFSGEGAIGLPGVYDRYRVEMAAGEAIRIQAFGGVGGFGGQFDMELRVYDSGFFEQAYNDDWNSLDPRIDFIAAVDGEYIVEVGGLGGSSTGSYRIEIDSIDAADAQQGPDFGGFDGGFDDEFNADEFLGDLTSVDFGSYEGTIGVFGEYDDYEIELAEGQAIRVSMEAQDGFNLEQQLDPYLRVFGPGGLVADNDDFESLNSRLDLVVREPGLHIIRASGLAAASIGNYLLTIEEIDAGSAVGGGGIAGGESEGELGLLSVVDEVPYEWDGNLARRGDFDVFDIVLDAGEAIRVEHRAEEGFDAYLVIRDESGVELAFNDDYQGLDSRIDFVAPAAGLYQIEARSLANCCSGPYRLTIVTFDPADA